MTYIENVFVCLAIPMILALFFINGRSKRFIAFVIIGMGVCLISAYINSFFIGYYSIDGVTAAIEIAPVCEEVMKLLPLLIYFLIFEPAPDELPGVAVAIAVGFATFENVCYLTANGAADISILLIRGISAGAIHILCGTATGYGISYAFRYRWLALTGTVGILGACVGFHAIYNLLVTLDDEWSIVGYAFPSVMIICLFMIGKLIPKIKNRIR